MDFLLNAPVPPLRQSLEAVPTEHEGAPLFMLRDLEGLTDQAVALSSGGMMLASLFDGRRTIPEIQGLFAKSTGTFLPPEKIQDLVQQLERSGLLETPEIAQKRQSVLDNFLAGSLRPASHKGTAYPENLLELAGTLGRFFKDPKGPGREFSLEAAKAPPPLGLVCPHIDFSRGGPAYAWAYQALSQCEPPDVILALGTAHMSPNSPWVMTPKAYETPYGPMAVDTGLYNDVKSALWYEPRDDEWVHRTEHSLEFQAVWLKYLWRDKTPPWVPVLCSTFERFCPDKAPSTIPTIEDAINKIGKVLKKRADGGQKILILSAVDLAHVGPRFGDEETLGPELEARIESEDRRSLDWAMKLEADPFYLSVVEGGHWRKVCGLSALYTSLRLIKHLGADKKVSGNLLTYGQAPDPMGGIVSFAGAVFGAP